MSTETRHYFCEILTNEGLCSSVYRHYRCHYASDHPCTSSATYNIEVKRRRKAPWVLQNGKIAIHFAGLVQYPNGSIA